jgi:CHASE2 domain-containing sensor protein
VCAIQPASPHSYGKTIDSTFLSSIATTRRISNSTTFLTTYIASFGYSFASTIVLSVGTPHWISFSPTIYDAVSLPIRDSNFSTGFESDFPTNYITISST